MRASSDRPDGIIPGADANGMRASDAERDRAIGELRDRFAEGRISQDTFLYRMDAALHAKDHSELSALFADLPGPHQQAQAGLGTARLPLLRAMADRVNAWRHALRGGAGRSRRRAPAGQPKPLPLCLPPQTDGKFTIGRALACDFTLADLSVSRWHAKLCKEAEHWMLSDLGSTNGTRLNGWRVTTGVQVKPGDQVSFGAVTFVITERPVGAA
jgi:hypothetical protein